MDSQHRKRQARTYTLHGLQRLERIALGLRTKAKQCERVFAHHKLRKELGLDTGAQLCQRGRSGLHEHPNPAHVNHSGRSAYRHHRARQLSDHLLSPYRTYVRTRYGTRTQALARLAAPSLAPGRNSPPHLARASALLSRTPEITRVAATHARPPPTAA